MADFPPRRFEFGLPAVCQQPFTHAGVSYKTGDSFPYEKLGIDKLAMRGYWLGSLVDFVPAPAKPIARVDVKPSKHAAR